MKQSKLFQDYLQAYRDIPIPDELEAMIQKTIQRRENEMRKMQKLKGAIASFAALFVLFIGAVNLSPAAASAMNEIPGIETLVRLVSLKEFRYQDENRVSDLKVPQLQGLGNSSLQQRLNDKYLAENKALYEQFLKEIGETEISPQKLALFTNFQIKTQTENLLVVERIKTEIAASGAESVTYDNIDLKNQIILTLPSLFQGDRYIDLISTQIKMQMKEQMKSVPGAVYFLKEEGDPTGFDKIQPEQTFYINDQAQLVIVFDEYAVAPGMMGIVEFVIPSEVLQELLVSNAYISAQSPSASSVVYRNSQYGFSFTLPESWRGYQIVTEQWEGLAIAGAQAGQVIEGGSLLQIRHPGWTQTHPRQDIPILIFTTSQWASLQKEVYHIGSAPIPPKELVHNAKYVFALPARYNYAFPLGFEEVEEILNKAPLETFAPNLGP